MNSYLKPMRRKIGVLALLMPCFLTASWIRSRSVIDFISYCPKVGKWHFLTLSCYGIEWAGTLGREDLPARRKFLNIGWESEAFTKEIDDDYKTRSQRADYQSNFEICGFQFCRLRIKALGTETEMWTIPYWSLVIPLTLLSAYLLLSKPRPTTAKVPA